MNRIPANWDRLTEWDQILVPTSAGYKPYGILTLMSAGRSILESTRGFGMAPLHFITQRGPYQDGSTPLDMRWDDRVIQIVVNEFFLNRTRYFDRRWDLVDLLRPNRSFGIFISPSGYSYPTAPLIYRKWLPGGVRYAGEDMVTVNGSATVTALNGKFVHNGLRAGMGITIGVTAYRITQVTNDYTLVVTPALGADATGVHYHYTRGNAYRDLYCLLEQGPTFDEGGRTFAPAGYTEALRFVAHDPFWYGAEQSASWVTPAGQGDLVFDWDGVGATYTFYTCGAYFDSVIGCGRWLFAEDYVGNISNIVYWGHEIAYPTITITGPATNPQISNTTTGITLTMDYDIAAGQTVTIDMLDLTAIDNFGADLYPYISGDVASFAIAPEPQAPNRENSISISYSNGTTASSAQLFWRNKYVSL